MAREQPSMNRKAVSRATTFTFTEGLADLYQESRLTIYSD